MPKKVKIAPEKLDELVTEEFMVPEARVIIAVNNQELAGEGETIEEAIINITPVIPKTRALVTAYQNGKKAELLLNVFRTKRLFEHKVFREIMSALLFKRLQ